ncbi:MAG: cbb3-type cytochrome c oxidase subunit II [Planctomycetes bacterium]|nr:cbb3-type cytochrome c oxidase subunit II [Planctomycetota bacterium]
MDRGMVIFLGALLTFTSSWLGLVFAPLIQINKQEPYVDDQGSGPTNYPRPLSGSALRGMHVYKQNGCMYCHSQQIRAETFGNNADIKRGWATRRTVARDYMYDKPIMLGTMRTGPDLANIGVRGYYADWHHKHLYDPRMMVPGSIMPPFRFLYEKRQIVGEPSSEALVLTGKWKAELEPGYEIVPTSDAKDLIAYLLSLDRTTVPLPESKE